MSLLLFILSILKGKRVEKLDFDLNAFIDKIKDNRASTLYPLLYNELKKQSYPNIPEKLKSSYYVNLAYVTFLEKEYDSLKKLLDINNINYLLYKGIDIEGKYYKMPGTRPMRDIDILINKQDINKITELLLNKGYEFTWSCNYHSQFKKNNVLYEVHTALFSYKYLIFFDLFNIDNNKILKEKNKQ